jgi:formylglycine-generating enzyme
MKNTFQLGFSASLWLLPLCLACSSSDNPSADAGADAAPPGKPCPSGRGPSMVRVPYPDGTFCIDSTEVTRAQYATFTADIAAKGAAGEMSLEKADICPAIAVEAKPDCMQEKTVCKTNCDNHPQVCVNWCAAYAYCKWAGKKLCGGTDGKAIKTFAGEPRNNTWLLACGNGVASDGTLRTRYAYGETPNDQACNSPRVDACLRGECKTVPVGSLPNCQGQGPYKGVFDLAGNVAEFIDERDSQRVKSVGARGSSFDDRLAEGEANGCADVNIQTDSDIATPQVGFRCCAD